MPRKGKCRIEGCDEPRVNGAFLCAKHLGDKRRCEGKVKLVDDDGVLLGERQCKRSALPGQTTCQSHGGSSKVAAHSKAVTAMQRFVQPYDGPLDPISAFEAEFRRTYGRILWLEDQIGGLEDERDLIWGITKEERVNASEFTGTNRTYEARIHVYEEMLRWERKHLLELEKTYIRANLDERRLGVMRQYIEGTYASVIGLVRSLGHDTADPAVRDKIRRMFEVDSHALEAIERP